MEKNVLTKLESIKSRNGVDNCGIIPDCSTINVLM